MSAPDLNPSARRPVVVLGPSAWNTMILLDRLPEPRTQMTVARRAWETVGGTSAGKAIHLHDLGVQVRLLTPLAEDDHARRIRAALPEGLLVDPLPTAHTERHINLMTPQGERISVYTTPPASAPAPTQGQLAHASAVVLDLAPWTRDLAVSLRRDDLTVWADLHDVPVDSEWHRPFWQAATVVTCSGENLPDPEAFLRRLVDHGVRLAVCTLGADGAIAVDEEGRLHTVAAEQTEVVDTNGAGDAFFAGVMAASLRGEGVAASLASGARQAVRAVRTSDLGPGVRHEEMAGPARDRA